MRKEGKGGREKEEGRGKEGGARVEEKGGREEGVGRWAGRERGRER